MVAGRGGGNGPYSAFADIGGGYVQRQQPGGLLTLAASRGTTRIPIISELTLTTLKGYPDFSKADTDCQRAQTAVGGNGWGNAVGRDARPGITACG